MPLKDDMPILHAGPIELLYEDGFLRYLKANDVEVLRMIYFALRDENWVTFKPWIENEHIKAEQNSFQIRYRCLNKKDDRVIISWDTLIEGKDDGTITFEIKGDVHQDVWKNRAGFCVLHPIGKHITGQPVEIIHPDGNKTSSKFPVRIDPENPFKNIQHMRWFTTDMWFRLDFEGDIFETEDQRNWTDASFKTFCTPLDLPKPALLKKGDTIHQKVVFKPESTIDNIPTPANEIKVAKTKEQHQIPALGIGASRVEITDAVAERFKYLPFSIYRIDIRFSDKNWVSKFSFDCVNGAKLKLKSEIVLHLTDDYKNELEAFVMLCLQNRLAIESVLLLHAEKPSTPQNIIDYSSTIKQQLPQVKLGAGTDYNFRELNTNRFNPKGLDFVCYSIQPQEHAFDDKSVMETLEAQKETVLSAKAIYPGLAIHVSPVTLKKRSNPYASSEDKSLSIEQQADERLHTQYGAEWTIGSITHLAEAGVASVTYFEATGLLGFMDEYGNLYPVAEQLKSLAGM
jgi:D-apionolactonase